MKVKVVLEKAEEGGFTVYAPSLKGCISEGETREEALKNIKEAIELYLETDIDEVIEYTGELVTINIWKFRRFLVIDAIKKLQRKGFIAIRQKGSHIRLEKRTAKEVIKLTVPLHKNLKKGTLSRIIKDAGLTLEEFNKL